MGLMILLGDDAPESVMLWLFLAAAVLLTLWECRERGYRLKVTLWWISFVAITHVIGYVVLRFVRAPKDSSKHKGSK